MYEEKGQEERRERYENVDVVVEGLKREKRKAKSKLTKQLNQVASMLLSEEQNDKKKVVELMEHVESQREETTLILEELVLAYNKMNDTENARKMTDELEDINEQVNRELGQARVSLLVRSCGTE